MALGHLLHASTALLAGGTTYIQRIIQDLKRVGELEIRTLRTAFVESIWRRSEKSWVLPKARTSSMFLVKNSVKCVSFYYNPGGQRLQKKGL